MNNVKDFFEYILNAVKIWIIVQPWQAGIKVRSGKRVVKLEPGIYFRLPYFDAVFIQEKRIRICDVPMQTLTTKDFKTITLSSAVGYSIADIEILYNTLYHPETTIRNMVMSEIAEVIFKSNLAEVKPEQIQVAVLASLKQMGYGLNFEYFKITNFAVVRTYRLIQDQNWGGENLKMNEKK